MTPGQPRPTTPDESLADATATQDFPAGSVEQQLLAETASTADDKSEWLTLDAAKFDPGSAKITAEAEEQIDHIATILEQNPQVKLEIGGYTSGPGSAALNKRLSQARANAIKRALVAKGVDADRLVAKGYGEQDKVEMTDEETESNRRVAVRVVER